MKIKEIYMLQRNKTPVKRFLQLFLSIESKIVAMKMAPIITFYPNKKALGPYNAATVFNLLVNSCGN